MRLASLLGPDLKETLRMDPEALRDALEDLHPEDIAELAGDLDPEDAVMLLQSLPSDVAAAVTGRLLPERQTVIMEGLGMEPAVELLREMPPDDRVDLLQSLPDATSASLIAHLEQAEPEAAEEVRELRAWDEDTAGGLMTPDFVVLPPDTKVWQAIEELRRIAREKDAETIYSIYVCGYGDKLLGVVSLRDLILSDPAQALSDVMTENVVRVAPTDDQESVALVIRRYDLGAVPVTDAQGRMLGIVTVDDVVDVVVEEATEDAQLMGGVVPLEDSYFDTGLRDFVWKRATWLIILFIAQMLTANVMEGNRATLQFALELAIFIPLIISSGGNAGSQSSSLLIRALAVGEVRPKDWSRVLGREVFIGVFLGCILGLIGFARAYFSASAVEPLQLALVVGASVVAVVTMGTLIGSLLPLGIRRLGLDPAVSSTPLIASLSDVLGLLVYFAIARLILTVIL
jgi:magnesium transporter